MSCLSCMQRMEGGACWELHALICAVHPGLFHTLMMQDTEGTAVLSELNAAHVGGSSLAVACTSISAVLFDLYYADMLQVNDGTAALSELYAAQWREEPVGSNTVSAAELNTRSTSSCL